MCCFHCLALVCMCVVDFIHIPTAYVKHILSQYHLLSVYESIRHRIVTYTLTCDSVCDCILSKPIRNTVTNVVTVESNKEKKRRTN